MGLAPIKDGTQDRDEVYKTRFESYDRAITLLQARADKMPSIDVVDHDLKALERITEGKFATIQIQFTDRDIALAAALAAAEKAVGVQNNNNLIANTKQEAAIAKQIDGIGATLAATTKGFDDKIDGVKERISSLERSAQGASGKSDGIDKSVYIIGFVIMALIALGSLIFEMATHHV